MARAALLLLAVLAGCVMPDVVAPDVVRDLAPTGALRVAMLTDAQSVRTVGGDMARELARRLGVPVQSAASADGWDIAFIGRDDPRARDLELSAPFLIVRGRPEALAVPRGRPIAIRYLRDF